MVFNKENSNSMDEKALTSLLTQQAENHFDDLSTCYHQVLRENLFSNRSRVRPAMLKGIATDHAKALLNYFRNSSSPDAAQGSQLYQLGLGEKSVLRLAQSTRQYFLKFLEDGQIAPALDLIDGYYNTLIVEYFRFLEKDLYEEQERARRAFLRVVDQS